MKISIRYWLLSLNNDFEISCMTFGNYYILRYYIMR